MKAGWKIIPMGQLCSISSGESDTQDAVEDGQYAFFDRSKTIKRSSRFLYDCEALIIPGEGKEFLPRHFKGKFDLHQRAYALFDFNLELDVRFLYYLLHHRSDYLPSVAVGATVKSLRRRHFEELPVPLPPLAEQKRIVALLDEAFARIDEAKEKAEACELSAINLFKSRMQDVFDGHDQAWAKKRLADVADFKNGLNFTRQSNGQTLQMVGVGDFQDRSIVPTQALQSVTIDGDIPDDYLLRRNDILTVRSNGSKDLVGRCMLVPELSAPASFSGFIIRIRLDTSAVSPRFFLHFMKSSGTRDRLMRVGGGANISNINQAKLSELPVAFPPLAQQEEIADQLDRHHELSLILANQYRRKIAAIDSLRASALQRAFAGELTA
jgi:type I restriction enzyme S subunit